MKLFFSGLLGLALLFFLNILSVQAKTMPEFTQNSPEMWINSAPLKKADLRGKVVLIEVWTSI
jgi:hypothetical protein